MIKEVFFIDIILKICELDETIWLKQYVMFIFVYLRINYPKILF